MIKYAAQQFIVQTLLQNSLHEKGMTIEHSAVGISQSKLLISSSIRFKENLGM